MKHHLLIIALLLAFFPAPQAAPTLERSGPNAARPLRVAEAGWLVAAPPDGETPTSCAGCALLLLGCNAVCTYRVTPLRLDWRARVGDRASAQGGRVWLPAVNR